MFIWNYRTYKKVLVKTLKMRNMYINIFLAEIFIYLSNWVSCLQGEVMLTIHL